MELELHNSHPMSAKKHVRRTPFEGEYKRLSDFLYDPPTYLKRHRLAFRPGSPLLHAYELLIGLIRIAGPRTTAVVSVALTISPVRQRQRLVISSVPAEKENRLKQLVLSRVPRRVMQHVNAWLSDWHAGMLPVRVTLSESRQVVIEWEEVGGGTVTAWKRRVRQHVKKLRRRLRRAGLTHLALQCEIKPGKEHRFRVPELRAGLPAEEAKELHLPAGLTADECAVLQPLFNDLRHSVRNGRRWVPCKSCPAFLPRWGTTKDCYHCREQETPWTRSRVPEWWRPREPDERDPRGRPARLNRLSRSIYSGPRWNRPKPQTLDEVMGDEFFTGFARADLSDPNTEILIRIPRSEGI